MRNCQLPPYFPDTKLNAGFYMRQSALCTAHTLSAHHTKSVFHGLHVNFFHAIGWIKEVWATSRDLDSPCGSTQEKLLLGTEVCKASLGLLSFSSPKRSFKFRGCTIIEPIYFYLLTAVPLTFITALLKKWTFKHVQLHALFKLLSSNFNRKALLIMMQATYRFSLSTKNQ